MLVKRLPGLLVLAALLGGLILGCGGQAAPTAVGGVAATPSAQPTSTATPQPPKVVRIGMAKEPDSLAGFPVGQYQAAVVGNLLFNVLVGVDDHGQPYPDLAESVPTLENGGAVWVGEGASRQLQTTFKLRPGLTWSDGQPLTSRDVKFTWDLMLNPRSGALTDLERKYEKVETPDDQTVVFTMYSEDSARKVAAGNPTTYARLEGQTGPVVDPLYSFGVADSWIYPSHVLSPLVDDAPRTSPKAADLLTKSDYARNPVGSGPYTLREWTPGKALSFEARPSYFKGAAKIQTVSFSFSASADDLIAQLKDGKIDVVTQDALDVTAAPKLDALTSVRPYYVLGGAWERVDFNLDDPILKDPLVRRALASAVDRAGLVQEAFIGRSAVASGVLPEWSGAAARDLPTYPHDPERAAALLDAAGWKLGPDGVRAKDGQKLVVRLTATDWSVRQKVAELLKVQLGKVGVDLQVESVASGVLLPQDGRLGRRSFGAAEYAWLGGFDPGADLAHLFGSASVPSQANGLQGGNYSGYRSDEVDRMLAAGAATLNPKQRAQIYAELQRVVMTDLPTLPLCVVPNVSAATTRLVGFKPSVAAVGETWNVQEWDLAN